MLLASFFDYCLGAPAPSAHRPLALAWPAKRKQRRFVWRAGPAATTGRGARRTGAATRGRMGKAQSFARCLVAVSSERIVVRAAVSQAVSQLWGSQGRGFGISNLN